MGKCPTSTSKDAPRRARSWGVLGSRWRAKLRPRSGFERPAAKWPCRRRRAAPAKGQPPSGAPRRGGSRSVLRSDRRDPRRSGSEKRPVKPVRPKRGRRNGGEAGHFARRWVPRHGNRRRGEADGPPEIALLLPSLSVLAWCNSFIRRMRENPKGSKSMWELGQLGFLEELLQAPRRDHHTLLNNDFFIPNGWTFDPFEEEPPTSTTTQSSNPSSSSFVGLLSSTTPPQPPLPFDCPFTDQSINPFVDTFTVPEMNNGDDHYPCLVDQEVDHFGLFGGFEETNSGCKVEMDQVGNINNVEVVDVGLCGDQKKKGSPKSRKIEGQPSKNLMAERRRRKRLNDRLSMLRSIVPKISKMDRTSILGDTIEYMKELLERVNKLQEESEEEGTKLVSLMKSLKDVKPNEAMARNSPKFHVERRDLDTRIDICCAAKPGLLLSTVSSLEALGLEIQQCVISCFNDFSMQASCSEEDEQRKLIAPEDIKQALFRTAGYGGRCL